MPRPPFRSCAGPSGDRDGQRWPRPPVSVRPGRLGRRGWRRRARGRAPRHVGHASHSRHVLHAAGLSRLGLHHGHVPAARAHTTCGLARLLGLGHGRRRAAYHRTGCCGRTRGLRCGLVHRAGVAAKPAATAMARVSFLMASTSGTYAARFAPIAVPGNSQGGERQAYGPDPWYRNAVFPGSDTYAFPDALRKSRTSLKSSCTATSARPSCMDVERLMWLAS